MLRNISLSLFVFNEIATKLLSSSSSSESVWPSFGWFYVFFIMYIYILHGCYATLFLSVFLKFAPSPSLFFFEAEEEEEIFGILASKKEKK